MREQGKTTAALIADSLAYERAYSRISRMLNDLLTEKNEDANKAKETGEPADVSYQILTALFIKLKKYLRKKSDDLWEEAEKSTDKFASGYDRLFTAIMERAVLDYEAALCGSGNASERKQIELLGMGSILSKVRKAHPKFVEIARENSKKIWDETQEARKKDLDIDEHNTLKCPLCGHTLYAYGKLIGGSATIKCTGCAFSVVVPVEDDNGKL